MKGDLKIMRTFALILLAVACVGCSKAVMHQTSSDLKTAAADIKNDPAVKRLGSDAKAAVSTAGTEVKKDASAAKVELNKAGSDAKDKVDDADHKS